MKLLIRIIFALITTFISIKHISKFVKRSQNKSRSKSKSLNKRQYFSSDPFQNINADKTITSYDPILTNNGFTTLTTGTYSSGGNIYQTSAGSSIPYGTGYSYGPWQKIPM